MSLRCVTISDSGLGAQQRREAHVTPDTLA